MNLHVVVSFIITSNVIKLLTVSCLKHASKCFCVSIYQCITIHFVVVYKQTLWRHSKYLKVMHCFE